MAISEDGNTSWSMSAMKTPVTSQRPPDASLYATWLALLHVSPSQLLRTAALMERLPLSWWKQQSTRDVPGRSDGLGDNSFKNQTGPAVQPEKKTGTLSDSVFLRLLWKKLGEIKIYKMLWIDIKLRTSACHICGSKGGPIRTWLSLFSAKLIESTLLYYEYLFVHIEPAEPVVGPENQLRKWFAHRSGLLDYGRDAVYAFTGEECLCKTGPPESLVCDSLAHNNNTRP